jgi:hypothetical protein
MRAPRAPQSIGNPRFLGFLFRHPVGPSSAPITGTLSAYPYRHPVGPLPAPCRSVVRRATTGAPVPLRGRRAARYRHPVVARSRPRRAAPARPDRTSVRGNACSIATRTMFGALARLLASASATERMFDRTSGASNECSTERVFDQAPRNNPQPVEKAGDNLSTGYPHPVEILWTTLSTACGKPCGKLIHSLWITRTPARSDNLKRSSMGRRTVRSFQRVKRLASEDVRTERRRAASGDGGRGTGDDGRRRTAQLSTRGTGCQVVRDIFCRNFFGDGLYHIRE